MIIRVLQLLIMYLQSEIVTSCGMCLAEHKLCPDILQASLGRMQTSQTKQG